MADIDSLSIKIEAESTQAAERVNALASSLERLKTSVKGSGSGFTTLSKRLEALISATNGLSASSKKLGNLATVLKNLENVNKVNIPKTLPDRLVDIAAAADLMSDSSIANLDNMTKSLQRLSGVDLKGLPASMKAMSKNGEIGAGVGVSVPVTADTVEVESATQEVEDLGKKLDVVNNKKTKPKVDPSDVDKVNKKVGILSNALRSIKRIAFYRAIRAGMKTVSEAFSTGIKDLYQYSKALKGEFADKMDMLATSALYLKNSLGSFVSPLITAIAPVVDMLVDKFVDLLNIINQVFAALSGKTTYTRAIKQTQEYAEAASGAAKAVKSFQLGIDELNVIEPTTGGAGGAGQDFSTMFEEAEISDNIMDFTEKLKPVLAIVGAIGAGFAAWKISSALSTGIEKLSKKLKGLGGTKNISIGFSTIGLIGFLSDMEKFSKFFDDFKDNGPTFNNVVGMLSEFVGGVGDIAIMAGNLKLGGFLKIVQGVGEIIVAIKDIADNGLNWDNARLAINGITDIGIGVGAMTGNWQLAGVSLAVQGLTDIITEVGKNWDAIQKGDWSGVDKAVLLIGALKIIGGVATALGLLGKLKGLSSVKDAAPAVTEVSDATSNVNSPLKELAKNLAWGIVIVAEVAAAAMIIIGSIQIMGRQLEDVGKAWQPVIDNGGTIATAIAIGTGLLVAIGLAAALLGKATEGSGGTIALDIGIGIGVLAEVGIAAGLFFIEIETVGNKLADIKTAWEPINESGEEIANDIAIGTALLVGVGVVAAAIGAVSAATGLAIPAMIAIGTTVLLELAGAFILFTDSIADVADQIGNRLAPALADLNPKIPPLTANMSNFTDYMSDLSGEISDYTSSMGSITWSSIVGGFQKLFAGNPIQSMADNVNTVATDTGNLNEKLKKANPELETAVSLMTDYSALMGELKTLTEANGMVQLSGGMFTNMKTVGNQLILGLVDGMKDKESNLSNGLGRIEKMFGTMASNSNKKIDSIINKLNSIPRNITTTHTIITEEKTSSFSSGATSSKTKAYASGGFPTTGQMFIAREAGPELVGTIGNKTAVANNDQIVRGIQQGVQDANQEQNALLREQNELLTRILAKTGVTLDGKTIKSAYDKATREAGATIMAGGVMA